MIAVLLALACVSAGQDRPALKFAGKSIPDTPRQKEPWTPPDTKLPRFLVAATAALFEAGMADPRGCEYREVEINNGRAARIRGFVLPNRDGKSHRFVVSLDGVIEPALTVGSAADVETDVRRKSDAIRPLGRAVAAAPNRSGDGRRRNTAFARGDLYDWGPPENAAPTALSVCLLLRLGGADLAEYLFAAGTTWTPEVRGRDLTDYGIRYLTLAQDWAKIVFTRLIRAHMGGDDAIALDAARRLLTFARAAEARAQELGFAKQQDRYRPEPALYFPFLRQLPELLADHERRAKEPARGPVPPRGGDPTARVAALIRDMDQIAERQMVHFGNSADGSPLVGALIAEGDAAVEPLLAAIETDTRLTRTTTRGRGMEVEYRVHPVVEPEFVAITGLLKSNQFSRVQADMAARKALAQSMRAFWNANRSLPLNERWYRTLRDDAAGSRRWTEAAANIVLPSDAALQPIFGGHTILPPPTAAPMLGEELRARRDPSVAELIARRALEIARSPRERTASDFVLLNACDLALMLYRWDSVTDQCLERDVLPVRLAWEDDSAYRSGL
jgi:hypothetical protein